MSLRIPATHVQPPPAKEDHSEGESSSEDEDEETWDDWVSDSMDRRPCKSLFEDKTFESVQEALTYDESTHKFSLKEITSRLGKHLSLRKCTSAHTRHAQRLICTSASG